METQLRGRQEQLEEIRAFLGGQGRDSLLVVSGDAGIGKTALLDFIADEAARCGAQVLGAKALEFEADLPFSTLNQLLLPLLGPLPELTAEHQDAIGVICGLRRGPMPGLLIAGAAALALLRLNASTARPLLLMVDDSPWMDLLSAMTLSYLGRRLREVPAKILVGARTEEDDVFVRSGFDSIVLPPLSDDVATTQQFLDGSTGPVVLVGHSYGGAVITEAGNHDKVEALVYITAFAPDQGESVNSLLGTFPSDGPSRRSCRRLTGAFSWTATSSMSRSLVT